VKTSTFSLSKSGNSNGKAVWGTDFGKTTWGH
jgi:hypothetical protein